MADRETKEIVTPGGHKVMLRTYLTGREANELKAVMYSAFKMNMDDAQSGKVGMEKVSGEFMIEQEQKAIGLLLVSLDENTEDALNRLLDLPQTDYDAVKMEVEKITNPTKAE